MNTDIARIEAHPELAAAQPVDDQVDLVELLLAGLAPQTRAGYRKDLRDFARFVEAASIEEAIRRVLRLDRGSANAGLASYAAHLCGPRKLTPATVRRRIAAVCRIFQAGRRYGLTDVTPEVALPRPEAYRDTAGPGARGWRRLLEHTTTEAAEGAPIAVRDLAVLLLLHDRGLRRGEVAALDWPGDVDVDKPAVQVLGKGRDQKVWLTVSRRAVAAVVAWVKLRGDAPGPLFLRLDNAAAEIGQRLSGQSINELVKTAATRAGLTRTVRAHGLRHQAITEALDQGWVLRDVMQFSRHLDPKTVAIYDDRRTDVGGEIAAAIAGDRRPPRRRK
jgi:integrase/recombinase XerC